MRLRRRKTGDVTLTLTSSGEVLMSKGMLVSTSDGEVYSLTSINSSQLTARRVSRWRRLWWWVRTPYVWLRKKLTNG